MMLHLFCKNIVRAGITLVLEERVKKYYVGASLN
jgi:hypothetical protein